MAAFLPGLECAAPAGTPVTLDGSGSSDPDAGDVLTFTWTGPLRLISEIGVDMHCWPTEHHFASWLTLAPNNKISGGKLLGSRTQPSANRAAKILRLAAMALVRGDHALGAFYRRLAARTSSIQPFT